MSTDIVVYVACGALVVGALAFVMQAFRASLHHHRSTEDEFTVKDWPTWARLCPPVGMLGIPIWWVAGFVTLGWKIGVVSILATPFAMAALRLFVFPHPESERMQRLMGWPPSPRGTDEVDRAA